MNLPAFIDVTAALQTTLVISTRRPLSPKIQEFRNCEFRMIQTKQSGFPYWFKISQSLGIWKWNPSIICLWDTHFVPKLQSNPAISNSVNSKSPLFWTQIEFPWIYTLMFSVIYYQLFWTRLFRIPRYFELVVLPFHLKPSPLFRTCQKQSMYMRAQLEMYCILFELDSRAVSH